MAEEGAKGAHWENTCPICGKSGNERSEYCFKSAALSLCPNPDKTCNNRSETDSRLRECSDITAGHKGDGGLLGQNIMRGTYEVPKTKREKHPLQISSGSTEAHHLISSALVDNPKWKKICEMTGYNINCRFNGIFLPNDILAACHLGIQRHDSNHGMGMGVVDMVAMSYVKAVEKELVNLAKSFEGEEAPPCDERTANDFVKSVNSLSEKIFKNIKNYKWTIAWDGLNYQKEGIYDIVGCANAKNISDKRRIFKEKLKTEAENNEKYKFIHLKTVYTIEDMTNLRKLELDALKEIKCIKNRNHQWNIQSCDHSQELTIDQIIKIESFKMEIGH